MFFAPPSRAQIKGLLAWVATSATVYPRQIRIIVRGIT